MGEGSFAQLSPQTLFKVILLSKEKICDYMLLMSTDSGCVQVKIVTGAERIVAKV